MALTKATHRMTDGAVINVKDFGATGDGVTDDYAALLAAVNSGKHIFFPSGTYMVSQTLNMPTGYTGNMSLTGEGKNSTKIKALNTFTGAVVNCGHGYHWEFEHIQINGEGKADYALWLGDSSVAKAGHSRLIDCAFHGGKIHSLHMDGGIYGVVANCIIAGRSNVSASALYCFQVASTAFNANLIYVGDDVVVLDQCNIITMTQNKFYSEIGETNPSSLLRIKESNHIRIFDNNFENQVIAADGVIVIEADNAIGADTATDIDIIDNVLIGTAKNNDLISVAASVDVVYKIRVVNNRMIDPAGVGVTYWHVNAGAKTSSLFIIDNTSQVTYDTPTLREITYVATGGSLYFDSVMSPREGKGINDLALSTALTIDASKNFGFNYSTPTAPFHFRKNAIGLVQKIDGVGASSAIANGVDIYSGSQQNRRLKIEVGDGTTAKFNIVSGAGAATSDGDIWFGGRDIFFYNFDYSTKLLNIDGVAGHILPGVDGTQNLGSASLRYGTVYAATGAINTSDDREKTYIDITTVENTVALELKANMRKFKFNSAIAIKGEDGARIHFGASAQTVKSIFEKHSLVAEDYAILCYDEWVTEYEQLLDTDEVLNQDGTVLTPATYKNGDVTLEAGNRYGLRYEELLSFIISAL